MAGRTLRALLLAAIILAVALAGCADEASEGPHDGPGVDVTEDTGGIRGVVVDSAIMPIVGATVTLAETEESVETDEDGAFVFNRLEPGTYIVHAEAPLYGAQQTSTLVEAGVSDPKPVKLQLERIVAADPYYHTLPFKGYITCSLNIIVFLSEECGEGVGVPGVGRVGGNPNNMAQIDFYVDNMNVKGFVIEQVWEPSIRIGAGGDGDFYTVFALDWACEPSCDGDTLKTATSGSPLYMQVSDAEDTTPIGDRAEDGAFDEDTPFSTFTWASPDETGVLLEQSFELYVTISYHFPMPEGWSFVADDPNPF